VRLAALVAVVRVHGAVLEERLAVAVCAAAGERSVERVEDLAVDPAERHAADQGSDVVTHNPS